MPSPGPYRLPLRGRQAEVREIERGIDGVLRGGSAVAVLSGEPGIGKSRLVQHALQHAKAHGIPALAITPDDSALSPFGALIDAATRIHPPLLTTDDLATVMRGSAPPYWLTRLIADGLEDRAATTGLLVVVDDLQWLDAGSLGAVRTLLDDLQGLPVFWLVATRSGVFGAGHQRLLHQLAETGAVRELPPLDDDATAAMFCDAFGSAPGPSVQRAMRRTSGLPLLVLELLRGLEEEGLLQVGRGVIDLEGDTLPARFGASTRDRLGRLDPAAQRIIQVGSLYGREFPLGGVLEILGSTATEAAPAVQALLDHDILLDTGERLAFRHDTVRSAASDTLSPTLRRAMAREVLHARIRSGAQVAALATTIAAVAEVGDHDSIDLLLTAAGDLAPSDTQGAADLVVLAARLTSGSPVQAERIADLLPIVLASGRLEEAMEIGRTLRPMLTSDAAARIGLAVARQFTESDFDGAIAEADAALEAPGLSDRTRVELLAVRALNYANKADQAGLKASLELARSVADEHRDGPALATIDATESVLRFNQGRFDEADRLQSRALARAAAAGIAPHLWLPEGLWTAFMRNGTGHCTEALRLADEGLERARSARNVLAEAYWMMLRSRVLYHLGRLDDARTQAETVLALGERLCLGDFMNATAGVVLHRVSLRTGDIALRETVRPLVQALADGVGLTRTGTWSLAMEAMERGRPEEAYEHARLALATLREATPSMTTPADFADDIVLTYICQLAGDRDAQDLIVELARERTAQNPGNTFVLAVALAVAGIRDRSVDDLRAAALVFDRVERPLVQAVVLEGAGLLSDDGATATAALAEALDLYESCGASRDASRVLRLLRRHGVNRRPRADAEHPSGLSHREFQVAQRIHAGLTTRQIAEELMVSPHTVVTYIRHIYAKWGVNTRREVVEHVSRLPADQPVGLRESG
ncbi:AAA family ATPase [Herbiconiux moechotypicola]|uniref:helix-turn-helix transcriptional regulator n=1 Tax=Herbiconiux moechotypicola TaxID=637393 RepID=UPI00217DA27D|nr:LuxR family transcriptional regulator [Herbiconiux moechotypicola]MCS5731379.1 AAA family ATPase [Herbiconiux moechotypicola]